MTRSLVALAFASLAAGACRAGAANVATIPRAPAEAASPGTLASREAHDAPPPRDDGRLPPTAEPRQYTLSLRIDPAQPTFSGTVVIAVTLRAETTHVVLHARDLTVLHAQVRPEGDGAKAIAATPAMRAAHGSLGREELVLTLDRPAPPGMAEIEIAYEAPFAADLAGLYRVEEAGRRYAYTQFEVADARRAFPCFDEPGFKTPFDVTIAAPHEMMALGNAPEDGRSDSPDGFVLHHFARSPPLPTYLVAFAVGEFDVVEWQKDPFPLRAITTKGRGNLTAMALEAAPSLVSHLAEYFDVPYPYSKLDLVAVPDFAAGAMENPGLVTFRDSLLLVDPRHATVAARRSQAVVLAHELAHMWFGDLVTPTWWDDLWLNEGFATWAEAKVLDTWRPTFGARTDQIAGIQRVMDVDALSSARAVRGAVRSKGDAQEAFDGIAYDKGAAILRMVEGWLGPDVFRRGVQRYLREHAWKNARADDLFKDLEFVSTQKVSQLAGGFLEQTGVPDVIVGWSCGGPAQGKLELSQSEWRPLGGAVEARHTWTLPVCVTTDALRGKTCFTLGRDLIVRDVGANCPAWVHPNADEAGYYRFVLDAAHLLALARNARALSPAERLGIVSNAWAEVRQGAIPASALLDLLPALDSDTNRHVIEQIVQVLAALDDELVDADDRDAFRRYVSARLGAREASLGWLPAPGEDDDRSTSRRTLLWAMGELAGSASILEEADEYATRWLRDPTIVPADTAAVAVPLASATAGPARLSQLRAAAEQARTPADRVLAIRAMGSFEDPVVLRKAFDLTLTNELRLSELRYLFGAAVGHRAARATLYAWEKENWDKLGQRLPGSFGRGSLLAIVGTLCTKPELDDAKAFFAPATAAIEGVKRQLDESLESAALCIALRDRDASEVARYLAWSGRGR